MITRIALVAAIGLTGCVIEYTVPADTVADDDGPTGTASDDTADDHGDDACLPGRDPCGDACFDLDSDPEHCGSCDHACAAADVCDAGVCASTCSGGRVACSGACVDLGTDPFHCGDCSETCDLGGMCIGGDCQDACGDTCDRTTELCVDAACECRSGLTRCDGACVDLETNPDHCGECGRGCEGSPCGGGECQAAGCEGFPDQCGLSCTDVTSDPLHCRECDRTCDGDEACVDGDCENLD